MNRQQRRALKKQISNETTDILDLMVNLATECLTCKKKYDKKDREMVTTWVVDVYKKEKRVDLFCPECDEKRKNVTN